METTACVSSSGRRETSSGSQRSISATTLCPLQCTNPAHNRVPDEAPGVFSCMLSDEKASILSCKLGPNDDHRGSHRIFDLDIEAAALSLRSAVAPVLHFELCASNNVVVIFFYANFPPERIVSLVMHGGRAAWAGLFSAAK